MSFDIEKKSMPERFQHLLELIKSRRFLDMQGLGNEIPFYICPFKPEESVEMEKTRKNLTINLMQAGVKVCEVNLYDISISLIKERNIWENIIENEQTFNKTDLMEMFEGILDAKTYIIPNIINKVNEKECNVVFISGVGEVFPYIRSHNILENLQSAVKTKPVILFFPGSYIHSIEHGASMSLFRKLSDYKYYRAFNIYHCEI